MSSRWEGFPRSVFRTVIPLAVVDRRWDERIFTGPTFVHPPVDLPPDRTFGRSGRGFDRERDVKRSAFSDSAFHVDEAAHLLHERAYLRHSEARSRLALGGEIGFEYFA